MKERLQDKNSFLWYDVQVCGGLTYKGDMTWTVMVFDNSVGWACFDYSHFTTESDAYRALIDFIDEKGYKFDHPILNEYKAMKDIEAFYDNEV